MQTRNPRTEIFDRLELQTFLNDQLLMTLQEIITMIEQLHQVVSVLDTQVKELKADNDLTI